MKNESTIIEYDELSQLYEGMMLVLNNLYAARYGCNPGDQDKIIEGHYLAAKMMTLMVQTRAKNNAEDPN